MSTEIPGYETFRQLLARLDPAPLGRVLSAWLGEHRASPFGRLRAGWLPAHLALDGKRIREPTCAAPATAAPQAAMETFAHKPHLALRLILHQRLTWPNGETLPRGPPQGIRARYGPA